MGKEGHLVTMSAGNYGRFVPFCFSSCRHLSRSYAEAARSLGLTATVLLPTTAPASRETLLKQAGVRQRWKIGRLNCVKVSVERLESRNLMMGVERHQANGATFLHPFDCRHLIAGHASLGLELVEQVVT